MSTITQSHDPVLRLYDIAQALKHLAEPLPEDLTGLGFIIGDLGASVYGCAAQVDDEEHLRERLAARETANSGQ